MQPQTDKVPLPEPSAELVLIRVFLESFLDGLTPKERARFFARVDAGFAERLGLSNVRPIRPQAQLGALLDAQRKAHVWWEKAKAVRLMRMN